MKDITKKYPNEEITVVWKPNVCIHSEKCFKGLPKVFEPSRKPWIDPEAADSDTIMKQIDQCPSGALSYYKNDEAEKYEENNASASLVETIKDGPLMVHGKITVKEHNGSETEKERVTAFCRCGASSNKPYCDGSHKKVEFKG